MTALRRAWSLQVVLAALLGRERGRLERGNQTGTTDWQPSLRSESMHLQTAYTYELLDICSTVHYSRRVGNTRQAEQVALTIVTCSSRKSQIKNVAAEHGVNTRMFLILLC